MIESSNIHINSLQRVIFIITEECNNKCVHCYNSYLTRRKGFMPKEIFDLGLRKLLDQGVKSVCISGGEALLHPDIVYFIEQVKKHHLHLRLYTNGQCVTEKVCHALQGMDLSPVSVTLYSCNDNVHDSITQQKGSLQKTIAGIKMFSKYNIPVQISAPVTRLNAKGVRELFKYCKTDLNVVSFGPNPFISYSVNHDRTNSAVIPSVDDIIEFAKEYYSVAIEMGFNIIPHKETCDWRDYRPYDGAELTIQYDGTVVAGTLLSDLTLGRIQNDQLGEIWKNSHLLNKWRGIALEKSDKCSSCKFLALCQPNVGDNWVANNDMLSLDKHWCECNEAYYESLIDWSDGGKYLIEVNGRPGFVFDVNTITEQDGTKYAPAFFSKKIAALKYNMSDTECEEVARQNIIVKIN